jgi:hypothetical protein
MCARRSIELNLVDETYRVSPWRSFELLFDRIVNCTEGPHFCKTLD